MEWGKKVGGGFVVAVVVGLLILLGGLVVGLSLGVPLSDDAPDVGVPEYVKRAGDSTYGDGDTGVRIVTGLELDRGLKCRLAYDFCVGAKPGDAGHEAACRRIETRCVQGGEGADVGDQ